jgi:hypothetical protein
LEDAAIERGGFEEDVEKLSSVGFGFGGGETAGGQAYGGIVSEGVVLQVGH